ncbi:MAG: metallophosphoesterase [Clostridiales bacterium]|jgi:predicted MPP superfamily phosphohydrolase|nr:metallophosphoesterase [Clostridiales bacterium]
MNVFHHKTKRLWAFVSYAVGSVILLHVFSALTLDRSIEYRRVAYASPKITPSLDGYTIAFVTDTHALPAEKLRQAVEKINAYHPDLLLLGGDFPSQSGAPERSMEILSAVRASDGIYGVEGNHDHFPTLFAAMEKYGITPLSNSGAAIQEGLYLCGVEDLWNRSPNIAEAASGAEEDDFVLLVAHNPDVTMRQDTANVDLVLSGHTHGGQITFLGLWAPALTLRRSITDYGRRFQSGWAKSKDGADVFVSRGTGTFSNIPRVFARPQIIVLTLKSATA